MNTEVETNYSVAGQQLSNATRAVLLAPDAMHKYGYAVLTGPRDQPEIEVFTFDTRADMNRALSDRFHGRFLYEKYPDVLVFEPDSLPHGVGTIEWDDDQIEEALHQRALRGEADA